MSGRFSEGARQTFILADEEARMAGRQIGTGELLLGVCRAGESPSASALAALGIGEEVLRLRLTASRDPRLARRPPPGSFSPSAKDALGKALRESLRLGGRQIGSEHILLGLAGERRGAAAQVLRDLGAGLDRLRGLVQGFRQW